MRLLKQQLRKFNKTHYNIDLNASRNIAVK